MSYFTYSEIKHIVDEACGDAVDEKAKAEIMQGFYNTAMMWGLTRQQCGDLVRVARAAYWAGLNYKED